MAAAPQSQRGSWASGDPSHHAAAFVTETRKMYRDLGSMQYSAYVQALGCAYAHAALMGCPLGAHRVGYVTNTLRTAEAVLATISREPDSEDGDDAVPEDDEGQGGADRLSILQGVMREVQQQQQAAGINISSSVTSTTSSTPTAAAAPMPPAFGSTPFPLPMDALFSIVHRLDAPSRARAAAACKRLRWVVQQVASFAAASPALVGFIEALQLFREAGSDWSDNSVENELAQIWPPDGSAVAGGDLQHAHDVGDLLRVLPFLGPLFEAFTEMTGSGPAGGQEGLDRRLQEHIQQSRAKQRPAPHPNSSPLASFVASEAVPYTTTAATEGPAAPNTTTTSSSRSDGSRAPAAAAGGARGSSSSRSSALSTPPAGAAAAAVDHITSACCDVHHLDTMCATPLHLDGGLMAAGYQRGWKGRDPGFGAVHLDPNPETDEWSLYGLHSYKHGLFDFATQVCADAGNALVWCAGDNGARIKAFRAPEGAAPLNSAAACNRGDSNMMQLQYTFCSSLQGADGEVAGLHVQGTRVLAVKGTGRVCVWDIADLAPAAEERLCGRFDEDECEEDAPEDAFRADIGWRDGDDI